MRVGWLACGEVAERFQHVAGTYTDMFTRLLAPHIPGVELLRFEAREGKLPTAPDTCDAWITTGSRASVDDDEPWIQPSRDPRAQCGARGPDGQAGAGCWRRPAACWSTGPYTVPTTAP